MKTAMKGFWMTCGLTLALSAQCGDTIFADFEGETYGAWTTEGTAFGTDLTWVKAHHDSPYGRIVSAWKREGDTFSLNIAVPANSEAKVFIPTSKADAVTESGMPAAKAKGVKFLRMESACVVYEVGSGVYHFKVLPSSL